MSRNVVWESLSADMSGEDTVVTQILDIDEERKFAIVRKDIDGENEEELTRLTKREMTHLSKQIEDAVLKYERER